MEGGAGAGRYGSGWWKAVTALLLLLARTGAGYTENVEAGTLVTVNATASSYDEGGCMERGCKPELTRDGLDNNYPDSRWSCKATEDGFDSCYIIYEMSSAISVAGVTIYFLDSTNFTLPEISMIISARDPETNEYLYQSAVDSDPGFYDAGEGEFHAMDNPNATAVKIEADLTAGQWININEVEIWANEEWQGTSSTLLNVVIVIVLCCLCCACLGGSGRKTYTYYYVVHRV